MGEDVFYTYIYLDPRKPGSYQYGDYIFDHEPFYVGKGKEGQSSVHLQEALNKRVDVNKCINKHKFLKIRKILKSGIEPKIQIIQINLSEQEAFKLEICLIWAIGRSDLGLGPLTNLTDGGEGLYGRPSWNKGLKGIYSDKTLEMMRTSNKGFHTPETINKIKISHKGMLGKNQTTETKLKISMSLKGRILSDSHINKLKNRIGINNPRYGKVQSDVTKSKISNRLKGRKFSEDTLKKMSVSQKRRFCKGDEYAR